MLHVTSFAMPLPAQLAGGGYAPWLELCRKECAQEQIWVNPRQPVDKAVLDVHVGQAGYVNGDQSLQLLTWCARLVRDMQLIPERIVFTEYAITTAPEKTDPARPLTLKLYIDVLDPLPVVPAAPETQDGA